MIENIKEIILLKSIELFNLHGFDQVTINTICTSCNITKKTFYYHYDSKNSLLLAYYYSLVDKNMENNLNEIDYISSWYDKCWKLKEIYVKSIENLTPNILNNLIKIDMEQQNQLFDISINDFNPTANRIRHLALEYTRQGQTAGEIRADVSAEDLANCFAAATIGLLVNWSSKGGNFDLAKAAQEIYYVTHKKP